ncbi:MAG: manganese transporter [Armatimonadia bacterium]|nr:manganese transporter [Armatimonadia bacterium]
MTSRLALLAPAAMVCCLLVLGCGDGEGGSADGRASGAAAGSLEVVCTTGMIADVARNVGGEHVSVTGLMGPGVDPHLYKATEGDIRRLTEADVILFNGLHLEAKMGEVLGRLDNATPVAEIIDESELLAPPEFEGMYDPHVWFDVGLWMRVVEGIRDILAEADPGNAGAYEANAEAYLAELEELHGYVAGQADTVPEAQRVVITAHDAFNYFGAAYGFEVRGLQGISTASKAGTADVSELAEFIANQEIPAIFVESSVSPQAIEAVQAAVRDRGFDVQVGGELFSDALGTEGTPEGTYIGMVRHNVDTITEALAPDA